MRVGLTGGVGSGKSTVAALFRERGAVVVDADQIARQVVAKGTPGLARVVAEFGADILGEDGELDRGALARVVFGDAGARRRLEAIVHPLVREESRRRELAAPEGALVVHDIPLLAETGLAGSFDAVVVVDVDEDEAVRRVTAGRGWTVDEARARMAAQASREQRRAVATYVIDNGGTRADLRRQVDQVYDALTIG